ncbi:MAG: hypothetical protein KAS47_04235, partial [Candidatus Heimdallarchaeota archaeon]|nr:hypothetical protein [Candidatus Heimdallarchaeota archaeon]
MKLPPIVRKLRKLSYYQISFALFIIAMLTPVSQAYFAGGSINSNANRGLNTNQNTITTITISDSSIRTDVRPEEIGSPYFPVDSMSNSGDNFNIVDNYQYTESYSKSLKFNQTSLETTDFIGDYYTTADLGYTQDSAQTNITSMTAVQDYYSVEVHTDLSLYLTLSNLTARLYAQGFTVPWDYANFTRAKIYLLKNGVPLSNDQLELSLVPAGSDGKPNVTTVLSQSGPYTPQSIPTSVYPDLPVYDFSDVTLTKGDYFILVNLTVSTSNTDPHVIWFGNDSAPYTNAAYSSSNNLKGTITWNTLTSFDFLLAPELYPIDLSYDPLTFASPDEIDLKDNGVSISNSISSLTVPFVGEHKLTSNTSVNIDFINDYYLSDLFIASSTFSASNSSFYEMTVDWNLTWTSSEVSTLYTLTNRTLTVSIPLDWSGTFNWYYNETSAFTS